MSEPVKILIRGVPARRRIDLEIGVQGFKLAYDGDTDECNWYASMLVKALHNAGVTDVTVEVE